MLYLSGEVHGASYATGDRKARIALSDSLYKQGIGMMRKFVRDGDI